MAELFQPLLQEPSAGPSSFVKPAVVDTSRADMLKGLAETGLDIWKGYEKSRLAGPDVIDKPEEVTFTDVAVDEAKGTVEVSPTTVLNLNKIAAGRKQGKISAGEARILVTAAVKEASSRMPGMAEDFRRQAAEFFGAYSPGWGLLEDEVAKKSAEEKRQEAQDKQMLTVAEKVGGEIFTNSPMLYGTDEERAAWITNFNNDPEVRLWAANSQYKTMVEAQGGLQKLDKPRQDAQAPLYVANRSAEVENNLVPLLKPLGINRLNDLNNVTDVGARGQIKMALNQWRATEMAMYNRDYKDAEPANRDAFNKFLDTTVAGLERIVDGKAKDEAAEDSLKAWKRNAAWGFIKNKPGTSEFLAGINQVAPGILNDGGPISQVISGKIGDDVASAFHQLYKYKDINSPATPYDGTHTPASKNYFLGSADHAVSKIESGTKPEGWTDSELGVLTSVVKGMENPSVRQEISQADYKQIFNIYTKPDWKELKKNNPQLAEAIEDRLAAGIDDYAVRAGRSLSQWAASNSSTAKKVEIGVTPDGRMMFVPAENISVTSPDYASAKVVAKDLNDKYQFGNMAKAWSNVFQRPQSDLLKELATKGYFPAIKMRAME